VDGSSAAAAHVAGVAALVISNYGRQTSGTLFEALTGDGPQGETPRLDAFRALSRTEILISTR
jgi:subtilisin family serine protease